MNNFRLDVYHHFDRPIDLQAVLAAIQRVEDKMSELLDRMTSVETAVTAETTVEQSAITLMQGLTATIADLRTQLQSSGDVATAVQHLKDLEATITARKQALADAIVANTPAG
jgi:hypothetical protein